MQPLRKFAIEVDDNGKTRRFRVEAADENEAQALAQRQIDLEHNGGSSQVLDEAHAAARDFIQKNPQLSQGFTGAITHAADKVLQGVTNGWSDEIGASIFSVLDWALQGPRPDGLGHYEFEKALRDELLKDADSQLGGIAGGALELIGSVWSGLKLAGQGVSLLSRAPSFGWRTAAGAAEGGLYGAVHGAGTNDKDRAHGALNGGVTGAVAGATLPHIIDLLSTTLSPLFSRISAAIDPKGFAENKLGQVIQRSGQTPQEIEASIAAANRAGQNNYTIADATGPAGQSALDAVMQLPSMARTDAINFLRARNDGMGRSVRGYVDDAFRTNGQTADQFTGNSEAYRKQITEPLYDSAYRGAKGVDLTNPLATLNGIMDPAGVFPGGVTAARDSVAPAGIKTAANLLTTPGLGPTTSADFRTLLMRKKDINDLIQVAMREGRTNEAGQLIELNKTLDAALEEASPTYRTANDTFRTLSQPMNNVPVGQQAAKTGQAADNIATFEKLTPTQQDGFRIGYADTLKDNLGGNRVNSEVNKILSDADYSDEVRRFAAPGRIDPFIENLQRSRTMLDTGNKVLGGSQTAPRQAAMEDLGMTPVALPPMGARGLLAEGWSRLNAMPETARDNLIPMLLSNKTGSNPVPVDLNSIFQRFQEATAQGAGARMGVTNTLAPAAQPLVQNFTPHFTGSVEFDPREQ